MKYLIALLLAACVCNVSASAETLSERRIREQAAAAEAATAAGQAFVERFTAPRGCEPDQERVVNDSRSGTRADMRYRDNPWRQNRSQVQDFRRQGGGVRRRGPSLEIFSQSYSQRREVCVSRP